MPEADLPVIVVGGGMTGLSAAWELQQQGVPYVLLEAGDYLGGKVHSELTEDGFLIERAADAFINGKPHALQLAREVGLEAEEIHPRTESRRLYFLRGRRLLDFPPNLKMFVPMDDESFRQSGILSLAGTERFLQEVNVLPKPDDGQDESLAGFMRRRFGEEALDFIVPMAAGIYVANPEELSMQASFPQFLAMERRYGSLIAGSRATPRATGPIFTSFRGGMRALPDAVAARLNGDVRLNTPVSRVLDGGVRLGSGEELRARAVISAVPAWYAAPMFSGSFPDAARRMAQFRANSSAAVTFAYRADQVDFDLNTHGLLVAPSEGLPMTAITVHSSKLAGRAPEGHVLMRVFFKATEPGVARKLAQLYLHEFLNVQGEPLHYHYGDWRGKNPAYELGHLGRVAGMQASLPATVRAVGCSFTGVGVPDCVNAGRTAAREVLAAL